MRDAGHVPNMTEQSTPLRARVGEHEFRALFETHFSDVWRFARRRCISGTDADDIAAEVFAVAWRRRDDLPVDQARLWLFGVTRRVLANHRRSTNRQARVCAQLAREVSTSPPEDPPVEANGVLREALAAMSDEDRELLIMRAWEELPVGDIAILLGCSPNAVSIRLFKARRRLAGALRQKEAGAQGHMAADPFGTKMECHEQS